MLRRLVFAVAVAAIAACGDPNSGVGIEVIDAHVVKVIEAGDRGGWSVDEDADHVAATARRLGIAVAPGPWARFATQQSVFVTSHFEALDPRWLESSHRLATASC